MNTNTRPTHIAHRRESDGAWQALSEHLFGVAALAKSFASKLNLAEAGELIGLLHDLGKYSDQFRNYLLSALDEINQDEDEDWVDAVALKGKVDHSSAGAQHVWVQLAGQGKQAEIAGQVFALCIASHHSGLIDCIGASDTLFGMDLFGRRMSKSDDKTHLVEVSATVDHQVKERANQLLADPGLTTSIGQLLDEIKKRNTGQLITSSSVFMQQAGLAVRFLFSCLIDADRIDTADFEHKRIGHFRPQGCYEEWSVLIGRLEVFLAGIQPRRPIDHIRQNISQHCLDAASRSRGIYTLTVPTGGGKTLASLRFALHHAQNRQLDRVIYVIPFTSIIDQNAQVARAILEPDSLDDASARIVLEHHGSVTPERQTWREKVLCENWDAPVVYTTMVQFLESLFGGGTRGARRMHQLANSVLVFDEIQTIPVKCVHLFNNAVNFLAEHCNATVVLCTATQPLLHQVDPSKGAIRLAANHELMPDTAKLFSDLRRVEIKDQRRPGGWSIEAVASLAANEVERAGSCLVIVNTKRAAAEVFKLCESLRVEDEVVHLSTDMCPAHRKQELAKIRERLEYGRPLLCVSTQLIEAGVDVDFGAVIRFAAGLDSIAQAAGRCNRNGRQSLGFVHVVNPEEEALSRLPDIAVGKEKAERVLSEFAAAPHRFGDDLLGPDAMKAYFEYYFFARRSEMAYEVAASDLGHIDTLLNLLSMNTEAVTDYGVRQGAKPGFLFRQAFMAAGKAFKAIDAPTQGVIVPFGKAGKELVASLYAAFDVANEIKLLRQAQQYTVNVFPHILKKLESEGALHEVKPGTRILCLNEQYYSQRFGLSTERISPMEVLSV